MRPSNLLPDYLIAFRRRLRIRDFLLLGQRSLWLALVGVINILVIGRFFPIQYLFFWTILPLKLWLCAVLGFAFLPPRTLKQTALEVDLELDLKERLSTAIEFERKAPFSLNTLSPDIQKFQQHDALSTAQSVNPHNAFPFRFLHRPLIVAAGLLCLIILLFTLPNPMESVLAEKESIKQTSLEQAEKVDELKENIELSTEISPELQLELVRKLDNLSQKLRENNGDREKALVDISQLEEELRRLIDPNSIVRQASLEAITAQLQSLTQQKDKFPTPIESLEQLSSEMENMSENKRQDLGQALAQMAAQTTQSGDHTLAQAMASMSQSLLSGDSESVVQSTHQLIQAIEQAQSDLSSQSTLQQSLDQLQTSSQAVAQAGQTRQQTTSQQPGQGNNLSIDQYSEQITNPGQGQDGRGQSGAGTKADKLPPSTGSGLAGKPNESDTGGASGDLGEQVFIPWDKRSVTDQEVWIPGLDTGQGETITIQNPDPSVGLPGRALIPYQHVYNQYFKTAQKTILRADIPLAYRDLVRNYFMELEP